MQATIITGMYSNCCYYVLGSGAAGGLCVGLVFAGRAPFLPVRNGRSSQTAGLLPEHARVWFCLVLILRWEVRACLAHDGGGVEPCMGLQVACDAAADGPVPGYRWSCAAAALGNAFPGAEPASGRQRMDARAPLRSREGADRRVQGVSARGLPPEADERVAGVRHGVDVPAAPTPF